MVLPVFIKILPASGLISLGKSLSVSFTFRPIPTTIEFIKLFDTLDSQRIPPHFLSSIKISFGHLSFGFIPRFCSAFTIATPATRGINSASSIFMGLIKTIDIARPLLGLMNQVFPLLPFPLV